MTSVRTAIVATMVRHMPLMVAETIAEALPPSATCAVGSLDYLQVAELMQWLDGRLKLFAQKHKVPRATIKDLQHTITDGKTPVPARQSIEIRDESGVLAAQRACRTLVKPFFGSTDCVRLVTVVSELARNIYMYSEGGVIELSIADDNKGALFTVEARDRGPGIADVGAVLSGRFVSKTGLGRGLIGSRTILDDMRVLSAPGAGTTVRGSKRGRVPG